MLIYYLKLVSTGVSVKTNCKNQVYGDPGQGKRKLYKLQLKTKEKDDPDFHCIG